MQLTYVNVEQTSIQVTLDEGEMLGNMTGPLTIFVPNDPANREYADILEAGHSIANYQAPGA